MGTAFMALSSILFQSAGSREPDRNIKRYVGQLAEFQSAGSREPDPRHLIDCRDNNRFQSAGSREPDPKSQVKRGSLVGFNPQARESLIAFN